MKQESISKIALETENKESAGLPSVSGYESSDRALKHVSAPSSRSELLAEKQPGIPSGLFSKGVPKISIIIIVKNDRGIADTLSALEKQARPVPTEIIVVDASAPSLLSDIREQHPEVRWYQFTPTTPNKSSIPEQRNFGIRHAQGEIIVFIDANCVPSENWLINLTKLLLDGTENMVAGSVRASDPKTRVNLNPATLKGDYLSSSPTINLAFKKELWEKVGGFDESFLFGSDVDFTWRCCDDGNKIRFMRDAFVTHNWGDFQNEIKRSYKYGKARARLFKKHPKRLRELVGDNVVVTIYMIYIVGILSTFWIWWYPLLILVPLVKNLGNKPVKTVVLTLANAWGILAGSFV